MQILQTQLERTGAYVAGPAFTLADIVLGLSTIRWLSTPIDRPTLPSIRAWCERLAQRPGYVRHCANGAP